MKTPIRVALVKDSQLSESVVDGLGAIRDSHRDHVAADVRASFGDSLDIDEAFRVGHDTEHRWDYLLGHSPSGRVVGLEPHSALDKEVKHVIKKRARSLKHLSEHLKPGVRVSHWYWVASGKVDFTAHEKTTLALFQAGITFVGKQLLVKALPAKAVGTATKGKSKKKR